MYASLEQSSYYSDHEALSVTFLIQDRREGPDILTKDFLEKNAITTTTLCHDYVLIKALFI
jgi:hypothetical protein